ncbi:hypothetical protein K474DRAFT_1657379 [Panus rudis PR-1116 ss-1]|nr:hypothetical protein K474DRAFT_1657379 [Panus rudis PR-1116 ss-1]
MSGINWTEARNALAQLAEVASKYDDNGIDIHFLNSKLQGLNMTSTEAVERLFNSVQPNGITEIGKCLERLMNIYLDELESEEKARVHASEELPTKPLNIIVITDGISSDTVSDVIVGAAKRLDAKHFPLGQLGVQFVQIGDDPEATTFLGELDDELRLEYKIRDMVDTTPYTGRSLTSDMLIKVLLGGINRLVDGKRGASRRV